MNVPFYDATREYKLYKNEFDTAISDVICSGGFILGKQVQEFEEAIQNYTRAKYAVGVANGSDALVIASDILGFKDGAEVVTPVFTFFASASCIARVGGKPVFCDVDEDTFCMDMADAENRITKHTKGILPVDLFLQTADMERCTEIARRHGLSVLEDAAEAFGMQTLCGVSLKHAGTMADFGVFSFFPTKTLGGYGDGGMIITDNEELYKKAKSYRVHGAVKKYHHDYIGYNSRLDTLQAAILNIKLSHIDNVIYQRAKHAAQYRELLQDVPGIKLPVIKKPNKEVNYVFCLQVERRDGLDSHLKEKGIGTSIYYPVPLHLQKCFEYLGHKKGDFPVAERLCEHVLALPMFPELTEDEVSYVCESIRRFYGC
ncbi:DegT/DnrJ/EryC1/StrS family aminotransferase [Breznakiella homolactica]|uniref:DegT/DnrJ/EryC1/StrS family aminotransferase n=1 Tax=Breznakiella homolactica TaxID=2798577 RepID=A0A7T7XNY7_9SPIR|nr:DegT/DnrJ/EryC1/StrS family aminotransferase [Breznakiella homolactica]QQO09834.1 DegT/DnrJ/EryC1/StrS family aminotransferase [Breznakiella homolactica]